MRQNKKLKYSKCFGNILRIFYFDLFPFRKLKNILYGSFGSAFYVNDIIIYFSLHT